VQTNPVTLYKVLGGSFVKKGKRVNVVRTIVYGKSDRLIADVTTNHVAAKS